MKSVSKCIVGCAAMVLLWSCSERTKEQKGEQRMVVTSERVKRMERCGTTLFPFITQPYRAVNLSFRVGGPIDRLDVQAGNFYRKGEVIASVDSRDYLVREARAKAYFEQMQAEYARIESLYQKNNVAASVYEKVRYEWATAQTAYTTAQNELDDTRLVAPFDGYVQEVYMERFQDVRPAQAVLSFIDIDRLKVEVYVPQAVAQQARGAKELALRFDTSPEQTVRAQVAEVSRSTTSNNLSFLVTALLPNTARSLPAGMSGKALFEAPTPSEALPLCVPQAAVRHRPSVGSYVWVITPSDSRVVRREVQLGAMLPDGWIEVKSGLAEGEQVATSGAENLQDGGTVRVAVP